VLFFGEILLNPNDFKHVALALVLLLLIIVMVIWALWTLLGSRHPRSFKNTTTTWGTLKAMRQRLAKTICIYLKKRS